jgi:dTMP kinase
VTGKLIVLEGIDGSGTTTQSARLVAHLAGRGLAVHETREPSRGPIGLEIRKILGGSYRLDPFAIALLFAADRLDHLGREIEPRLDAGVHVVSDRYVMSSLAYQSLELDRGLVATFNERARPADLTVLLDVPAEVAAARRKARGGPAELFDADDFQARVAEAYRREAERARNAGEPVVILDGTPDADRVAAQIATVVGSCIGTGETAS